MSIGCQVGVACLCTYNNYTQVTKWTQGNLGGRGNQVHQTQSNQSDLSTRLSGGPQPLLVNHGSKSHQLWRNSELPEAMNLATMETRASGVTRNVDSP